MRLCKLLEKLHVFVKLKMFILKFLHILKILKYYNNVQLKPKKIFFGEQKKVVDRGLSVHEKRLVEHGGTKKIELVFKWPYKNYELNHFKQKLKIICQFPIMLVQWGSEYRTF